MAEILSLDWVSRMLDYGLVLFFLAAFIIFLKVNWKDTYASAGISDKTPAPSSAGHAVQSSKAGIGAGTSAVALTEITAVITAAINEYRKQ